MCECLLLVRYNDVAGVWRSNLLVSQMDLTLATKTERDSDSESGRERRGEEKKGARGRQQAGTLLELARNSSQAALMLKLILVHTLAHKHGTQHTHARTNGVSGQRKGERGREREAGHGEENSRWASVT